jgi:hypothetical protein
MSENTVAFEAILAGLKWNQTGEGECIAVLKIPEEYNEQASLLTRHVGAVFTVALADPRSQQ